MMYKHIGGVAVPQLTSYPDSTTEVYKKRIIVPVLQMGWRQRGTVTCPRSQQPFLALPQSECSSSESQSSALARRLSCGAWSMLNSICFSAPLNWESSWVRKWKSCPFLGSLSIVVVCARHRVNEMSKQDLVLMLNPSGADWSLTSTKALHVHC